MKNDYQEIFRSSDPEEIEQEKKKRSALISLFPKRLGIKDETQYVLLKDEEPEQSGYFEDTTTSMPNWGVVSDGNKISREHQYRQIQEVPGFNDSKAHNTPEQKNTFSSLLNPKSQANERKAVYESKIAQTANDCLKVDTTKVYRQPPQIGSSNFAHNTSIDSIPAINDTKQSENKLKLYFRETGDRYTHQINELKAQLPKGVQNVLNELGTEIRVVCDLHTHGKDSVRTDKNGIYNANKITLDSKHVDKYTLLSEAIHAVQNYLGMGAYGKSNLEFQEHVIKDLYFQQELKATGYNDNSYGGLSNSNDDEYIKLIFNSLDQNGFLDLNGFLSNIENYIDEFQENYTPSNSYQTPTVNKFNYNWIKLFDIFGIKYK